MRLEQGRSRCSHIAPVVMFGDMRLACTTFTVRWRRRSPARIRQASCMVPPWGSAAHLRSAPSITSNRHRLGAVMTNRWTSESGLAMEPAAFVASALVQ